MTRNNADFHGVTISHKIEHPGVPRAVDVDPGYKPDPYDRIWIEANHPTEGRIGQLYLVRHNGEGRPIGSIDVDPKFQRKGIATAMWDYAKRSGFQPLHSPQRTPDGDAWAKSTGDPMPKFYSNFD